MRFPLFALLLAAPLLSNAQQPPVQTAPAATAPAAATTPVAKATAPKPAAKPKAPAAYKAAPPAERATRLSQQIGLELGLDTTSIRKVRGAALLRAQKIDAIQTGTATNKAKNTALEANAQDFKAALKAILTPDQFTRYSTKGAKKMAE